VSSCRACFQKAGEQQSGECKNGKVYSSKQKEKVDKEVQADPLGSLLDSPKNLWKIKEGPSRKAYSTQEKLAKDQA
jgi:hypothetical protein